jgi:hypothetical protein
VEEAAGAEVVAEEAAGAEVAVEVEVAAAGFLHRTGT